MKATITTKTEAQIIELVQNGQKTFSRIQNGERMMSTLLKMIEQGKLQVTNIQKDYFYKSIGGAQSLKPTVLITVSTNN